jgi:4'-phosphopantetheinyl transferase EntD
VIGSILPEAVVAVEARDDSAHVSLFPAEEVSLGRPVEKRRREFTTARGCARAAFDQLGLPPSPVPTGSRGEPRWPSGVVGSITHCDNYRACAIARSTTIATIGIDAMPHLALQDDVVPVIAVPPEVAWLSGQKRDAPAVHWDALLFSAKESVYKAWFPIARRSLHWEDLRWEDAVVTFDVSKRVFVAQLLVDGPFLGGQRLAGFEGRWLVCDGLVMTAIAVPATLNE